MREKESSNPDWIVDGEYIEVRRAGFYKISITNGRIAGVLRIDELAGDQVDELEPEEEESKTSIYCRGCFSTISAEDGPLCGKCLQEDLGPCPGCEADMPEGALCYNCWVRLGRPQADEIDQADQVDEVELEEVAIASTSG